MKFEVNINRWTIVKVSLVCLMLFGAFFAGATWTVPTAFNQGYNKGYETGYVQSLTDANNALKERGIQAVFDWEAQGNGSYKISLMYEGKVYAVGHAEVHVWIQKNDDPAEFGAGVLTNIGKSFLEWQISGNTTAVRAIYCSDSNDATDPALATWTILPSEITTNGLDRQQGTYTHTGAANSGTWNVSVTKTATATQSTQLWGLNWVATDNNDGNLLAVDTTPAQKNLVANDTLKETWQIAVT